MTERVSKEIRAQVRERGSGRCEYCRKPETVSLYPFHVDHVIPTMHGGDSLLDNLAWACFRCNTNKSSHIASYDTETKDLTPLFNPRTQTWDDYFEMQDAVILGKNSIGRVTVRLLQINHPDQIATRAHLIRAKRW